MPTLDKKKPSWAPAYVTGIYPALAGEARRLGYALALHGSLTRDFDVVAVPWSESAVPAQELVANLAQLFDLTPMHPLDQPVRKPHGRLTWVLPLWWGAHIDLSVMPRRENETSDNSTKLV
jgi:hypothetical protein